MDDTKLFSRYRYVQNMLLNVYGLVVNGSTWMIQNNSLQEGTVYHKVPKFSDILKFVVINKEVLPQTYATKDTDKMQYLIRLLLV